MNARICLIIASLLIVGYSKVRAQVTRRPDVPRSTSEWGWIKEVWSGDERPYQIARQEIDKAIAAGTDPVKLLDRARTEAQKKPKDPLLQFRWGYIAFQASVLATRDVDRRARTLWVREALAQAPSPSTYEYSRLRYLIEARRTPQFELIDLGERLLSRNPKDYRVLYLQRALLSWSPSLENKQKSLTYAQELVRLKPDLPSYHGALAGVYDELWHKTKEPEYATKAIAEYREYLRLAPATEEFRRFAQRMIEVLEKEQAALTKRK